MTGAALGGGNRMGAGWRVGGRGRLAYGHRAVVAPEAASCNTRMVKAAVDRR